jgi:CRISPR-associated protein Csb1
MTYDPEAFLALPRVLVEADLKPLQGERFQPTGFPNLGAASYQLADGTEMLLVESPQSIANRLEAVAWDDAANDLVPALQGLPYVRTTVQGIETDSIREAHRLNSPYLEGIRGELRDHAGIPANKKDQGSANVDRRKLAAAVFYYDPGSVLHGVFLEKIVGGARLTRLVSGFIEARDVRVAASGGVKNDRLDPSGKEFGGGAKAGFGNVPFSRTEYTAGTITAYFSIDVTLLRSYGLPPSAQRLLLAMGLWKVRRFLETDARLRTACDLRVNELRIGRSSSPSADTAAPELPAVPELEMELRSMLGACGDAGLFASPAVTVVAFAAS